MFAEECIIGLAELVEDIFHFPSDVLLPSRASQLNNIIWEWSLFRRGLDQISSDTENLYLEDYLRINSSIIYDLEEDMTGYAAIGNLSHGHSVGSIGDIPTISDWDILNEIESSEEDERLEREEVWPILVFPPFN